MQALTKPERAPARTGLRGALRLGVLIGAAFAASSAAGQNYQGANQRCLDLERQLVSEWQRSNNPREAVTRIDKQLDEFQRERQELEREAEQRECYEEFFIFGRSLRRTESCIKLDRGIERLRRDIANLQHQRDSMTSSGRQQMRRDELVAELARYGCGETYEREYQARRGSDSFFSLWEDEDTSFDRGYANRQTEQSALPFASYRTMCVRLCDGFYFPISFSTLGSRFSEDEAKCQDQCAAPAELFVYKNPGEDVEQMISLTGKPYDTLENAWRHRKEYVKGCSCKPEEYSVHQIMLSDQEKNKQASVSPDNAGGGSESGASSFDADAPAQPQDQQPQPAPNGGATQ